MTFFSPSVREPYITPSTREQRLNIWLEKLQGLRGRQPLPPLSKPVLLLVDLQNLFLDSSSPVFLPAWPGAHDTCTALLKTFRLRNFPIIWTRHESKSPDPSVKDNEQKSCVEVGQLFGRPVLPLDPLAQLAPEWIPREEEMVIIKHQYSAWSFEDLDLFIPPQSPLILAGVSTNRCILATAVDSASRGRVCIVAADACASTNEQMHESALAVLAGGFAYVAATSEILTAIGEGDKQE